jgi:hypothetical protein
MRYMSFCVIFGSAFFALAGCSTQDVSVDITRGQTVKVHGKTAGFAFFVTSITYQMLPEDKQSLLAEDYVIDSPDGIGVESPQMRVGVETTRSGDSSYEAYVIEAGLTLRVPENLPEGEYQVTISFPNAIVVRDFFGATAPVEAPRIRFTVNVFESIDQLAGSRWRSNLLLTVLMIAISIVGFKSDSGFMNFWASIAGLVAMFFLFQSVRFLWMLSPWFSVLLGLNLGISIKAAYQRLWK